MSFTSKGTHELLIAGYQDTMFKVDVEKGTVIQTVSMARDFLVGHSLMLLRCRQRRTIRS